MYGQSCDSLKRDNEYLRDEIERRDREESERREREYQEQENRRRQRQQEYQESLCYADSWTDAFGKAISKLAIEAREEEKDERDFGHEPDFKPTTYFRDEIKATQRAQELFAQEMAKVQEQISALEQAARERVAAQLETENFTRTTIIPALRDNDFQSLVDW